MPVDEHILGFSNRWYPAAIETAQTINIAGHDVRVVTPALFIATKLEAFHGRGGNDVIASHDLEDIMAVVDGRAEIVDDVAAAPTDVRDYIASELRALLDNRDFVEALGGFLLPDAASQGRRGLLEAQAPLNGCVLTATRAVRPRRDTPAGSQGRAALPDIVHGTSGVAHFAGAFANPLGALTSSEKVWRRRESCRARRQ